MCLTKWLLQHTHLICIYTLSLLEMLSLPLAARLVAAAAAVAHSSSQQQAAVIVLAVLACVACSDAQADTATANGKGPEWLRPGQLNQQQRR